MGVSNDSAEKWTFTFNMRFAYLILAHNSFGLLKELISFLDNPNNDIYIHLDEKIGVVDFTQFLSLSHYSKVCFIDKRVDVAWGGVSLVEATLNLLEASVDGKYDYYHLLSGVDFPIKSNEYIQKFFKENEGKEFIGFANHCLESMLVNRLSYYHIFNGHGIRNSFIIRGINAILINIQKLFHIHHHFPVNNYKKGAEWFSITHGLCKDIVDEKGFILKHYKYTLMPDEIFLQSYVYNSDKYRNNLYNDKDEDLGCMRKIDWLRGQLYVWQLKDYEELVTSPYLFARKFSERDMVLIHKLSLLNNKTRGTVPVS